MRADLNEAGPRVSSPQPGNRGMRPPAPESLLPFERAPRMRPGEPSRLGSQAEPAPLVEAERCRQLWQAVLLRAANDLCGISLPDTGRTVAELLPGRVLAWINSTDCHTVADLAGVEISLVASWFDCLARTADQARARLAAQSSPKRVRPARRSSLRPAPRV